MTQKIIDAQDNNGNTPLHLATKKGHANTIRALLDAGAKVDIANNKGETIDKIANTECSKIINDHLTRQNFEAKEITSPPPTPTQTQNSSRQR
jgi:ankyrin repeat protein